MREPLLEIEQLDCGILENVSLTVGVGETVCLAGPSGSGKSRLLRAIADLDPNRGQVRLRGELRQAMPANVWRRRVGYLPAESHWWAERVGEHMESPDEADLHALGFTREVLGWQVARLSSGERARLALLRLWSMRPEVLLLDEPTASLDPERVRAVERWLAARAAEGCGLLWVSHDREQITRVADRALEIRDRSLLPWA